MLVALAEMELAAAGVGRRRLDAAVGVLAWRGAEPWPTIRDPDRRTASPRAAGPKAAPIRACCNGWCARCTKTTLVYDAARQELISRAARLAYPIRDGIPVMPPDEARALDDDELRNLGKR